MPLIRDPCYECYAVTARKVDTYRFITLHQVIGKTQVCATLTANIFYNGLSKKHAERGLAAGKEIKFQKKLPDLD